jgi:hypothetical protein
MWDCLYWHWKQWSLFHWAFYLWASSPDLFAPADSAGARANHKNFPTTNLSTLILPDLLRFPASVQWRRYVAGAVYESFLE